MNLIKSIIDSDGPFLIAGPCSAESEFQMMEAATAISKKTGVSLLRAGIWKPRTRPNSFEGIGAEALPWLVNAGKKNGVPVTTEVANAKHVEAALKAGVDVLWVGARTTVNPFAVQEIADALSGVQIPVMVKNPINPDLMLWIGAFERLAKAGVSQLIAIHRGFSIYNHPKYRNIPNWEIPIALKEEMDNIPVICDPSHISGKREGLLEVAQKAMDLNFDGLMIESHLTPDQALSDPQQQVTPEQLAVIMKSIKLRSETIPAEEIGYIELMRDKINTLDDKLFSLLAQRMRLAEEVGIHKRENEITILQQAHWKQVIAKRMGQSDEFKLTPKFVRSMMDAIHQESIRHQTKVMNPDLIKK